MREHFERIVIGGGIIGLSCALRLGQRGGRVLLCEQEHCGSGASGAALGALWPASPLRLDYSTSLQRQSLASYPAFVAEVQELSQTDVGYKCCGALELIRSDAGYERAVREVAASKRSEAGGFKLEIIPAQELRQQYPELIFPDFGAIYCQGAAKLIVPKLLQALRLALPKVGVELREQFGVTELWREGNRILGIVGPHGRISADQIVIAAGMGSRLLDSQVAADFPLLPVKGQAIVLQAPRPWDGPIVRNGLTYIVPWEIDSICVGSTTEPEAGYNLEVSKASELRARGAVIWPALANSTLLNSFAGLRPKAPDQDMYLGPSKKFENLYLATGHYKTGIGMAPVTALKISELLSASTGALSQAVTHG